MQEPRAQNTETSCSKCTNVMLKYAQNVMLKMHKRHAQNAQTLCSKCGNVVLKMHKSHAQICTNVMLKVHACSKPEASSWPLAILIRTLLSLLRSRGQYIQYDKTTWRYHRSGYVLAQGYKHLFTARAPLQHGWLVFSWAAGPESRGMQRHPSYWARARVNCVVLSVCAPCSFWAVLIPSGEGEGGRFVGSDETASAQERGETAQRQEWREKL